MVTRRSYVQYETNEDNTDNDYYSTDIPDISTAYHVAVTTQGKNLISCNGVILLGGVRRVSRSFGVP